ncbi:MAG: DUF5103 domain-containing protein [Saprospiraceae bacterium]|nr:DUF5103 domain-containing protein [Saprospiraceae bacterium]
MFPIKKIICLFCLTVVFPSLKATEYPFHFYNTVYDENIKSLSLEVNNLPTNFPIIKLNSGDRMVLKFDDLLNEERIFYYRFIHCNMDWTPSPLREFDYLNGFNDERLRNFEYSVNTKIPYIHYWQEFPNRDSKFNVSGNYLIVIYEESIENPILTRRFVVMEEKVKITPSFNQLRDVSNFLTHQDFQFNVSLNKLTYRDPQTELALVVLQNENWDINNADNPNFLSRTNARFTKSKSFSFKGLSEFREFDTRGLLNVRRGIQRIERKKDKTEILLTHGSSRKNLPYLLKFDFNGKYFVGNIDALNIGSTTISASDLTWSTPDELTQERDSIVNYGRAGAKEFKFDIKNTNSDYVNVIFTLDIIPDLESDAEIFVLGSMNDWEPREEFRMKLSENGKYLITEAVLKQGYYNYYYGILKNDGTIDYATMEGSWNETENDYQAIAYFKGFGDIYDRVVGFTVFNTTVDASLKLSGSLFQD